MSIEGDSSNSPLLTFPLELATLNTKGTKPGNKASTGNDLKKKENPQGNVQIIQHTNN